MTDAPRAQNQQVMYLLIVIAVLLAAIIGIVLWQNSRTAGADSSQLSAAEQNALNPGMKPSTGTDFDAKTATKVPAGMDPKKYVETYYDDILKKKYDEAFKMQPAASQQGVSVSDFQASQEGYGMTSFKVVSSKVTGAEATVEIQQDLGANGKWGALWTFEKVGGTWLVKSRQVSMQ